ncbi:unnamed protein product [Soboliphyme baturini]|uniref:Methyltransf_25 domain-containing protein n=1 Tax=Soboliphyme baturini TaxID=241478 RepID=A0A183IUQ4_9BILA|nr:unnamed protein product [Soboliphyme baturini]
MDAGDIPKSPLSFFDQHDLEVVEGRQMAVKIVVDLCARFLTLADHVVDVLAGSGVVGIKLANRGFHNVHAHEVCPQLLELLRQRHCYRSYILGTLKPENCPVKFNAAVLYCSFAPGHLTAANLDDVVKMVIKGGFVIMCIRELWLQGPLLTPYNWDCDLSEKMIELERNQVWELCHDERRHEFCGGCAALFYVYKIL